MASVKANTVVEFAGNKTNVDEVVASVKKKWTEDGKLVKDIKSLDVYIKPEDSKAYYVVNESDSGCVEL